MHLLKLAGSPDVARMAVAIEEMLFRMRNPEWGCV